MRIYKNLGTEVFEVDARLAHPEGKIALLDGSLIEGFPRQTPIQVEDNTLSLDTTGEYLQIRRKKVSQIEECEAKEAERERIEELFCKNAFFLWSRAERILSDSRMFLTPLPVNSGLAYIGTSGFRNPTLGVYIEWWTNCMQSRVVGDDGSTELIWFISGSPLSGSNCCCAVNEQGIERDVCTLPFNYVWHSFVNINVRYDKCKEKYEAYSLEEVLDILHSEPDDPDHYKWFMTNVLVEGLQFKIREKKEHIERLSAEKASIWNKYLKFRISKEFDRAKQLLDEYNERARICQEKIEEQNLRRKTVKRHRDDYTATTFQNEIMDVKRKKQALQDQLQQFKENGVKEIFPDGDVHFEAIEHYVNEIIEESNKIN